MRIRRLGNQLGAAQQAEWAEQLLRIGEGREAIVSALGPDHIEVPPHLLMDSQGVTHSTSCVTLIFEMILFVHLWSIDCLLRMLHIG